MKRTNIIAIDGPAGSGKSTVAREAAKELGFLYIDTGAMYRALTLKAVNKGLDLSDREALLALSKNTDIELKISGGDLKVYLDKEDVSEDIRKMEITEKVKHLASLKGIREKMVGIQRELGCSSGGAVLEGRDIGTVVFPDAAYKFYLDADLKTRVVRRFDELREKRIFVSLKEVEKDLKHRDLSDMKREVGALKKAEDASVIDTTDMTVGEVVKRILGTVAK